MSQGQLLVFMVSSFWHGFYFGYYLSFFLWFVMQSIANLVFRITKARPQIMAMYENTGKVGQLGMWFFINVWFSYFGCYFQIMAAR
jgi:hypothetical protein